MDIFGSLDFIFYFIISNGYILTHLQEQKTTQDNILKKEKERSRKSYPLLTQALFIFQVLCRVISTQIHIYTHIHTLHIQLHWQNAATNLHMYIMLNLSTIIVQVIPASCKAVVHACCFYLFYMRTLSSFTNVLRSLFTVHCLGTD